MKEKKDGQQETKSARKRNEKKGKLPPHLELQRTRVSCKADAPIHTEGTMFSGAYASLGFDNGLELSDFCDNLKVNVIRHNKNDIEFDMIGIDAAIANAFRRILIAEVPTMAIEKVFIANNTSVIPDEILSHRLGLIPINVDPRLFEHLSENDAPNERNTIVFKLRSSCKKGESRRTVYSNELKWLRNGSEFIKDSETSDLKPRTYTSFCSSQDSIAQLSTNPIYPTENIIIAKLGPGQEIELEAHAVKGIGSTHAKWSPVATAWYRMLPEVVLMEDIFNEDAVELKKKCPVGVFDVEDIGPGKRVAKVARPRACTLCRECIRDGQVWQKRVSLRRVRHHFIFTIESTGALPPEALFVEAVKILEDKCHCLLTELS